MVTEWKTVVSHCTKTSRAFVLRNARKQNFQQRETSTEILKTFSEHLIIMSTNDAKWNTALLTTCTLHCTVQDLRNEKHQAGSFCARYVFNIVKTSFQKNVIFLPKPVKTFH